MAKTEMMESWSFRWFVCIGVMLAASSSCAEYIPPGPKFVCPKNNQIWPCVCLSSTDDGTNIRCEDVSLATLSSALHFFRTTKTPIQILHILNLNTERLYGNVFEELNVTKLTLEDSPIQSIFSDVFYKLNNSLVELEIIKTHLEEYRNEAYNELGKLETLTIDQHRIQNISEPITGLINLKALRISNGNITAISKATLSQLGKLNRLDLHGNALKDFPKEALLAMKNVEFLDIAHNKFDKLDPLHLSHLVKLTWFNASHNLIPEFKRGAFARNNFLRVIYLTHNKIPKLEAATFRGMRLLRRLYLSDNQISDVGRSAFASIPRVGTIDLARNKLKVVDYQMFANLIQAEVLDVSENQITTVKGDAFRDLSYVVINMSHNQIEKFEKNAFVNCINITVLDLSHNQIDNFTKGTFDEFSFPNELKLEYNKLTSAGDIPMKTFTGTKILNASHNSIEVIPKNTFPKLYELHTVDFSHNEISTIQPAVFTTLFSLRYLDLSYNKMTKIRGSTLGTIPTLIEVTFDHNKLNDVAQFTFSQLSSLRSLRVSHNEITSAFQVPQSLGLLDISYNKIESLQKAWPVMNSLLKLNLNGNNLGGKLEAGSFENLRSLQEIHLKGNNLTEIPREALADMTVVQVVDLSENSITNLTRGALGRLPIVLDLRLQGNKITQMAEKTFEGLLQLLSLDLSRNNLSEIPVGALASLVSMRRLNLSRNALERTDNGTHCIFEDNLSLEFLDLSHNQIGGISMYTFPNKPWTPYRLGEINLSYNNINIITKDILIGTRKLRKLNLSHNRITEIRQNILGNLTTLQGLYLSDNNLGMIEGAAIGPPPNLTELDLSGNGLRKFPTEILLKAPLKLINLTRNKLEYFNPELIPKIMNGSRVIMNQNPLKCDCRLILLTRFFNDFRPKLSNFSKEFYNDLENFQCGGIASPKYLKDQEETDLTCDPNSDPFAPNIQLNYDLEIRNLVQRGNDLEIRWRVRSKEDVAGFKISAYNEGESEIWKQLFTYDTRSAQLTVPPEAVRVCLSSRYSRRGSTNLETPKTCNEIEPSLKSSSSPSKLSKSFHSLIILMTITLTVECFLY